MNIAAAVQLIRRIAGCDQACGGLGHEDCGFHIAYTHDVLDKFQLNSLKGLGGVNTHSVLGKVAGKGHEAEDKLGEVSQVIQTPTQGHSSGQNARKSTSKSSNVLM